MPRRTGRAVAAPLQGFDRARREPGRGLPEPGRGHVKRQGRVGARGRGADDRDAPRRVRQRAHRPSRALSPARWRRVMQVL